MQITVKESLNEKQQFALCSIASPGGVDLELKQCELIWPYQNCHYIGQLPLLVAMFCV